MARIKNEVREAVLAKLGIPQVKTKALPAKETKVVKLTTKEKK